MNERHEQIVNLVKEVFGEKYGIDYHTSSFIHGIKIQVVKKDAKKSDVECKRIWLKVSDEVMLYELNGEKMDNLKNEIEEIKNK